MMLSCCSSVEQENSRHGGVDYHADGVDVHHLGTDERDHEECHGDEELPRMVEVAEVLGGKQQQGGRGRKPRKRLCTKWVRIYFMNILLINIIITTDGNTSANVAVALPSMDMPVEKPALCTAV